MNTSDKNTCANCGKEGSGVTNTCNKCKSVTYCNAACKKKHRSKHKKECERRVAELHDEKLFKQPPPLYDDCPICMIRLPSLETGTVYMACCGKLICGGCVHAFQSRATKQEHNLCPFCRTSPPYFDEEIIKRLKKRMELDDAQAIHNMGGHYSNGSLGLLRDHVKALELWHRAAELGFSRAYTCIGNSYKLGEGVEVDEKKARHYFELAAMRGHATARHNLGYMEGQAGKMDRSLRHFFIAVKDGEYRSLLIIKRLYSEGHATKDDYAKALRSYQSYLDEVKSDQRDEAAAAGR